MNKLIVIITKISTKNSEFASVKYEIVSDFNFWNDKWKLAIYEYLF